MKIVLSSKWRKSFLGLFVIELAEMVLLLCLLWNEPEVCFFMMVYLILMNTIVQLIVFACFYRKMIVVFDTEMAYKSYLLKKELCTVKKDEPVFYKIFEGVETRCSIKKYVAISNNIFDYEAGKTLRIWPWDKKPFLLSFDIRSQIVMPYDKSTIPLMEMWICIDDNINISQKE